MNCSYRILKNVHIGQRVRKTSDKNTVPFNNDPVTGVKIVKWNQLGFELQHEKFPKNIWVDFNQLPLDSLNISYGVIQNPITFVEQIFQYGTMVLIRADTFDYLELLEDHKIVKEAQLYKISQLVPGDRVISSLCREGNVMVYLGTFYENRLSYKYDYNWRGFGRERKTGYIVEKPIKRAYFAYEKENGKFSVEEYALENKVVKDLYRAAEKEKGENHRSDFADIRKNLEFTITECRDKDYSPTWRSIEKPSSEEILQYFTENTIHRGGKLQNIFKNEEDWRKFVSKR